MFVFELLIDQLICYLTSWVQHLHLAALSVNIPVAPENQVFFDVRQIVLPENGHLDGVSRHQVEVVVRCLQVLALSADE